MVSRRLQKRIEGEAAEKQGKAPAESTAKKRKTATSAKPKKPAVRKRKVKAAERKRLLWGVFSGTLKEEGRFPYDQLDKAEERLDQLRAKSKKQYFIQPIKEVISDNPTPPPVEAPVVEDEEPVVEAAAEVEDDAEEEEEAEEEE